MIPHVVPMPVPSQIGLPPCGAPMTAVQRPSLPRTSQAAHCPVQEESQQRPSTQYPEPHSAALAQVVPRSFAHTPLASGVAQECPAAQLPVAQQTPSTQ